MDSLTVEIFKRSYLLGSLSEESRMENEKVFQENLSWLSPFNVGLQLYNPNQTGSSTSGSQIGFSPTFGVSLNIDLEKLIAFPSRVRIAEANQSRVDNTLLHQKREIRIFVEMKYYDYLLTVENVKIKKNTFQNQSDQENLIRQKFEKGEAKLEEVLLIQSALEQTRLSILESQFQSQKIYRELFIMSSVPEDFNNLMKSRD